jgi:hypothetical protein
MKSPGEKAGALFMFRIFNFGDRKPCTSTALVGPFMSRKPNQIVIPSLAEGPLCPRSIQQPPRNPSFVPRDSTVETRGEKASPDFSEENRDLLNSTVQRRSGESVLRVAAEHAKDPALDRDLGKWNVNWLHLDV